MTKLFSLTFGILLSVSVISFLAVVIIIPGYTGAIATQSQSHSRLHGNNPLGYFGNLNTSSSSNQFNIPSNTNTNTTTAPNTNQFFNSPSKPNPFPDLPPPLSTSSSISINSLNKNAYSISGTFAKVDNFVTTYTIMGGLNSIKSSADLIISTITKDFNSNANIGYVRGGSSSSQHSLQQQNTLPNPFVDKSMINQTISTSIQNAISSSSLSIGGYTQIKCNFGMYLADYSCNSNVPFLQNR